MALYFLDHGETKRAIDHCRTAIELDPGYSEAYQSLGTPGAPGETPGGCRVF